MPWPIRPAPITAMRALAEFAAMSACRVAAIRVEDVAGVEVRGPGGEEQERAGEVGWLAQAALRHAGDEALAHRGGALGVLVHPGGERQAENGRRDGVDRDAGVAPLAAERLGDAVDGGL